MIEEKIVNTYCKLLEIFKMSDLSKWYDRYYNWEVIFTCENGKGLRGDRYISSYGGYGLRRSSVLFNPSVNINEFQKAITSLIFYTTFFPRAFATVKPTGSVQYKFLFWDFFGPATPAYVRTTTADSPLGASDRYFLWYQEEGALKKANYLNIVNEIIENKDDKYLSPSDLRNFLAFTHLGDDDMDIISYMMLKMNNLFERLRTNPPPGFARNDFGGAVVEDLR